MASEGEETEAPPVSSAGIAAVLRQAIVERRLTPGAKLPEDQIGEIYGAGRTVVRGALQELAHAGLVTLRRHRGASVAQPGAREAREVFEARALLEPRTARSAAERATRADLRRLHGHIAEEHAALAAGDMGRAVSLSGRFHTEIAAIADQATIAAFVEALVSRSSLILALYWKRRDALCERHAHEALLAAIAAGDGRQAEELMRGHLVDLLSGLDLRESVGTPLGLREALTGLR